MSIVQIKKMFDLKTAKVLALAALTAVAACSCARPLVKPQEHAITVSLEPPKTTVRYLDGMYWPQGAACGRAYTYWSFICRPEFNIKEIPQLSKDHEYMFDVSGVSMTLSLPLTIWLPFGVKDKLRLHEDGHRKMCEQTYKNAEKIARECAQELMSRHIRAYGADAKAAQEIAETEARRSLDAQYHQRITDIADGSSEIYDRITNHGMNEVPEDKAIKESFEEYYKAAATPKVEEPTDPKNPPINHE